MDAKQVECKSDNVDLHLKSVVLKRLMEEVAADDAPITMTHYNRTHNRHNR